METAGDCESDAETLVAAEEDPERRRRMLAWTDRKGRTPLVIAAQKGHLSCVLELLRFNVDIHSTSNRDFGGSALHEAVYYKWRSDGIVEALLRNGANPFLKNAHDRTVLDLALIENAPRDVYMPWLMTFDRYGYFAEELMVRTQFLHALPTWVSRWVTVVPNYRVSDSGQLQVLKKTLIVYDGYQTRRPISHMDLTSAHADLTVDSLRIVLGESHPQPVGVASTKHSNSVWCISLSATFHDGIESLNRLARVVNEQTPTIIEQQLQHNAAPLEGEQHAVDIDNTSNTVMGVTEVNQSQPLPENVRGSEAKLNPAAISVYNGTAADDRAANSGGVCVVCLDKPQSAGFLHGDSVHRCVCDSCAFLVYLSDRNRCPICREQIDRVITGLQ